MQAPITSDLWGYPSVVIAIASDPTAMKQALNKRAHFPLQKPFTPELMTNTLKAELVTSRSNLDPVEALFKSS